MSRPLPRGLSRAFSRLRNAEAEAEASAGAESGGGERGLLSVMWETGAWRIFPLLVVSVLGFAVLFPVLPLVVTNFFAQRRSGGEFIDCATFEPHHEPPACQNAHSDSVMWSSYTSFVSQAVVGFLLAPCIGRWSDQYGRKPFLVASSVLSCAPLAVFFLNHFGFISFIWWYPALVALFTIDKMSLSVAFCADLMPPSLRAACIGGVTGSLAGALFVAPYISRRLSVDQLVMMLPVLAAIGILWAIIMVPETTTEESRAEARRAEETMHRESGGSRVAVVAAKLTGTWTIVMRSRLFLMLTVMMMLVGITQEGIQDLILQYLQLKLNFGVKENTGVIWLIGIGGLISQLVLLPPLLHILGAKWVLVLALVCQGVQQVLLALANTHDDIWIALSIGSVAMMSFPTLSAIKSNNSAEHEQGAVQGALFGAKALASGCGPLVFAPLFAAFTRTDSPLPYFPGGPFLLGAALMVLAVILGSLLPSSSGKGERIYEDPKPQSDLETPLRGNNRDDPFDEDDGDGFNTPQIDSPEIGTYYGPGGDRRVQPGVDVSGASSIRSPSATVQSMPSIGEGSLP